MIASLLLTETGGLFDASSGASVDVAQSTSFDHAALVAAKLSRVDGYDFRAKDGSGGRVAITSISGANSTTCRLIFNIGSDSLPAGDFVTYSVEYGDLSRTVSPFSGTPGPTVASLGAAVSGVYTFETLTLPVPSFPTGETMVHDIDSIPSGLSRTTRTAVRNKTARRRSSLVWRGVSSADAYQIRAFVFAQLGGVSTFSQSLATFLASGTYRVVPGTLRLEQMTLRSWNVALDVEEIFV